MTCCNFKKILTKDVFLGKEREREYWMIYRGPGFLAVVWFIPPPPFRQQIACLSQSSCVSPVELTTGRGGGGGGGARGAKSYHCEKAWPSMNQSKLFARRLRRELFVRSGLYCWNGMFVSATWTRAPPPLFPCPAFPASLNSQPSRYYVYSVKESRGAKTLNWLLEPESKLRIAAPAL